MLVSTKGRYALRVMLQLAEHYQDNFTLLDTIAEEENISEKYLENIVRMLVKANLIHGQRGRGGGYRLLRQPNQYTIGEILRTTEGSLAPVACLDCNTNQCERASKCKTLPMWRTLDRIIENYLNNTTLEDLLKENNCITELP